MRVAVRRADNAVIPDFQAPGPAPGALAASVASRYGGVAADYLEVEAPVEMVEPIMARTHDPLWDGQVLALTPHVKTQVELDAEALAAALAQDAADLDALDWSTIDTLVKARAVIKKLSRLVRRKAL